jgi:hypothetical protein
MRNVFRTNVPLWLLVGCSIGGGIMIIGGVLELSLGVVAEGRELEQVTRPQTAVTATQIPRVPNARGTLLAELQPRPASAAA